MKITKTSWIDLIRKTKRLNGSSYTFKVYTIHYLFGKDTAISYTFKNKWRAMLNMKLYAIWYDFTLNENYGIYFSLHANE